MGLVDVVGVFRVCLLVLFLFRIIGIFGVGVGGSRVVGGMVYIMWIVRGCSLKGVGYRVVIWIVVERGGVGYNF